MLRVLCLVALVILGGCATAPRQISNVCAVFNQRDGWMDNWQTAAERASREYGVPVPILMATIYTESGFRPYARPPRQKILWVIPWKRPSSAYGYAQALDGTWKPDAGGLHAPALQILFASLLGITIRQRCVTVCPRMMPIISILPIIPVMMAMGVAHGAVVPWQ